MCSCCCCPILQAYVIATSAQVDISKVDVSTFDDSYFKKQASLVAAVSGLLPSSCKQLLASVTLWHSSCSDTPRTQLCSIVGKWWQSALCEGGTSWWAVHYILLKSMQRCPGHTAVPAASWCVRAILQESACKLSPGLCVLSVCCQST